MYMNSIPFNPSSNFIYQFQNTDYSRQSQPPIVSQPYYTSDMIYSNFLEARNSMYQNNYSLMAQFIRDNIKYILTSAVDKSTVALKIITDGDFLTTLDTMDIASLDLSRDYVNRFNRIYRSYSSNPSNNVIYDQNIAAIMYNVALKLNKKDVTKLTKSTILREDEALWIIINRFSSTDERRNIRRTVRTIQHMSQDIMTDEVIVKIFKALFESQINNLFCAIMTDRFDAFDSYNEEYVYSTVTNATLDVLNTLPSDEIKDILIEYNNELENSGTLGRIDLNTISVDDYRNIFTAIDEIKNTYGINIH